MALREFLEHVGTVNGVLMVSGSEVVSEGRGRNGRSCKVSGNAVLCGVILGSRPLRVRHELLIVAGLAVADLLYGLGLVLQEIPGPKPPFTSWQCTHSQ